MPVHRLPSPHRPHAIAQLGACGPAMRAVAAGLLLAAACALGGCVSTPAAGAAAVEDDAAAFLGSWAYAQSCGLQQAARLDIEVLAAGGIHGEWSDGTRVAGDSGYLSGRVRDGRLDIRLCHSSGECPPPSADADAHLRREGAMLVWYRRFGDGPAADGSGARSAAAGAPARHERYLSLHPVVGDADPPLDNDCKDDPETL